MKPSDKIIELTKLTKDDLWTPSSFYGAVGMDDVEWLIARVKRLTEALEDAREKFHLILMQRENFPEDAAINCANYSSEGMNDADKALEGE